MDFYQKLNYSLGNEDWFVEKQAMCVQPNDNVICITASGDRPLHFLLTDCSHILSVDMNPVQNYLLELKLLAINILPYDEYLAFLGLTESRYRLDSFKKLSPHLSTSTLFYWNNHLKKIINGIIYQGKVEQLTSLACRYFNFFKSNEIKTLFSFTNLEEQCEFISHLKTFFWKTTFNFFIKPSISKFLIKDPGLNSYTDFTHKPGQYFYDRMIAYLQRNLAKKSPLLQIVLRGKISEDAYFPYLTFEGYQKIQKNYQRLQYQTANIIDILHQYQNHFDCFSLSDIASYMPQSIFETLLTNMAHAAKKDARFCLRQFMSKRMIPHSFENIFQRDSSLEKKLEEEETNFIYRFMTGKISPPIPIILDY